MSLLRPPALRLGQQQQQHQQQQQQHHGARAPRHWPTPVPRAAQPPSRAPLASCAWPRPPRALVCARAARDDDAGANAGTLDAREEASQHVKSILELCKRHDLEGLIPFMGELAVVKAVVRQHEARAAWQRREERAAQAAVDGDYSYWPSPMPVCPVPGAGAGGGSGGGGMGEGGGAAESADYAWDATRQYRDGAPIPRAPAAPGAPDFTAILDAAQSGGEEHHLMDSFAMRHLVLSRPAALEPLSSMMLSPGHFVARAASTSPWGERCVLTLTLRRRSKQELSSHYSKHPHKQPWVLTRVSGEPLSCEPLEAISPEHPPEAIVAAQVQAFKDCDFDVAYALTSPVGRAVAGTRERFRAAMQADFRYQPILAHASATSVHRTHSNANTYLEVFRVQSNQGGSNLFIWVATRQLDGLYKNCWLVEYVTPVQDRGVIKALQLGY